MFLPSITEDTTHLLEVLIYALLSESRTQNITKNGVKDSEHFYVHGVRRIYLSRSFLDGDAQTGEHP